MKLVMIGIILGTAAINVMAATESPYKGQESRTIKALSQQEIDGYLKGKGMGYAKAAELNHYPGPRHVLDLSRELGLTAEQIQQSQTIFDTMQAQAVTLGRQFLDKERELDSKFASNQIDAKNLDALVAEIGALQAKIRAVHLSAHLAQKLVLSQQQIQQYSQLRGYGAGGEHRHHHAH